MTYAFQTSEISFDWGPATITTVAFGLLLGFWLSVGLETIGVSIPVIQALLGVIVMTVVPGWLLTHILGIRTRGAGEFSVFAIGLSLVVLSITTVLASVVLPVFGISDPLSFVPLASLITALIALLALGTWFTRRDSFHVDISLVESPGAYALLSLLPMFAVLGALLMNRYNSNYGMAVFVLAVAVVTVFSATRAIQPRLYSTIVYLVALSTLLHRNLATTHVVGADIQFNYFLSETIASSHQWAPDIGGATSTIPVLVAVPPAYSAVTGIDLTTVFLVVYPLVFSFVPLAIYYLGSDVFDADIALYGSLFFVFYHGTFYLTPGKQRISELFIVLLLLLYFRHGTRSDGEKIAIVLLAIGLVHSHYGSTYIFGFSFLVASIALVVVDRFVGEVRHGFSPIYPVAFLLGATAWYAYASRELIAALATIPFSLFVQLATLPEGVAAGSGASYVQQQEAILQQTSLSLYILLTVLFGIGIAWKSIASLDRIRRGTAVEHVEFTALAIPLFAFLGMSYFLIVDLWADRVYQMVLPVLAHFAAFGYLVLWAGLERIPGVPSVNWSPVAVVLAVLFVINAGLAGAVMGTPTDYTFDDEAHDYAFSDDEREAAEWLEQRPDIERIGPDTDVDELDDDEVVPIYTDRITSQLFRSVIPESHYNVEIVMVKDEWDSTFDPEDTRDGYVFIRHNAIEDDHPDDVPLATLSATHVDEIVTDRSVAYENDDATVVEPIDTTDETDETIETTEMDETETGDPVIDDPS